MNQNKAVTTLQDIIRIPSVNDREHDVAQYIQGLLAEYGINSELVEYQPGRSNLVAELKGTEDGKILVFSGHMDVVAAGDPVDWTYPPFDAHIEDDRMYGRGTTDMKAGVMALVWAMIRLKEDAVTFKGTLRLVLTVGEEIGMYGSKQMTELGYVDDADAILIAEPSGPDQVIYAHRGSLQYQVIAKGKAAHSSTPENGIDALQLIVDYIQESNRRFAEALPHKVNPDMGASFNVNTVIQGGDQINSVAGQVTLSANARTVPEFSNDEIIAIIEDVMAELSSETTGQLELNVLQNNPPAAGGHDSALVQAIRQATGRDIPATVLAGATDASNFGRVEKPHDLAIFGPGVFNLAHALDEYVSVSEYLEFIDIFTESAKAYLV